MKLSLAKTSGLGPIDPLFGYLQKVDQILAKHYSWGEIHLKQTEESLFQMLISTLGDSDEPYLFCDLCDNLQKMEEPVLANLTRELLDQGFSSKQMRITLMFIFINLENFKVTEARLFKRDVRTIDAGWIDDN